MSQGQAAAARLRAAKQQQAKASNDKENDAANEDADAAQHDLDTINGELVRRTGQSVTLDGVLETGWAREMIVQGHSELQVSDTVSARLQQGGIEATSDLSDEEVMERQARIREAERQQLRDDIIRKETGRDPDDLDPVFPVIDNPVIGAPKPGFGGGGLHSKSGFFGATADPEDPDGGGCVGDNAQQDTMSDVGSDGDRAFAASFDLIDTGHLSLGLHLSAAADLQIDTDSFDLGE